MGGGESVVKEADALTMGGVDVVEAVLRGWLGVRAVLQTLSGWWVLRNEGVGWGWKWTRCSLGVSTLVFRGLRVAQVVKRRGRLICLHIEQHCPMAPLDTLPQMRFSGRAPEPGTRTATGASPMSRRPCRQYRPPVATRPAVKLGYPELHLPNLRARVERPSQAIIHSRNYALVEALFIVVDQLALDLR